MSRKYANDAERIRRNVAVDAGGCWIWSGDQTTTGYGRLHAHGRVHRAHRFAYEVFVGPVPGGLPLDHLCRKRACCNPEHLEPVTQHVNLRRSPDTITSINAAKTECVHGHPFDEANTYITPGGSRRCRACRNAACNANYHRKRAAGIHAA